MQNDGTAITTLVNYTATLFTVSSVHQYIIFNMIYSFRFHRILSSYYMIISRPVASRFADTAYPNCLGQYVIKLMGRDYGGARKTFQLLF